MTEVAGEVADGFLCHGFTTEQYLREVTLPALERGRAKAGKTMEGFEIMGPSFVVTGTTEEELATAAQGTKQQIAFYGSTPAYKGVLDAHGWGGLQDELNALSKQGKWVEMGDLIDDEILNTFAVVGEPETIAPELHDALRRRASSASASTPRTGPTPSGGRACWPRSAPPNAPPTFLPRSTAWWLPGGRAGRGSRSPARSLRSTRSRSSSISLLVAGGHARPRRQEQVGHEGGDHAEEADAGDHEERTDDPPAVASPG